MQIKPNLEFGRVWPIAIVAFSSGAIVMSLEIAGSRLLTPVFGSSTYTWGILIGIVLSGLTIGYHLGGRISDSNPSFKKLSSIVFSTGLFILFIPFVSQNIVEFFVDTMDPLAANFLSSLVLFGFPTILLGFVSPYAIKLCAKSLLNIGTVSGNLYSISTMGSIFGTFLTVFILIPFFEINDLILGLGIILMAISLLGLGKIHIVIALVAFFVVFVAFGEFTPVSPEGKVLALEETPYSSLLVLERDNFRTLYLDGAVHSSMDRDDPNRLVITYTKSFHLADLFGNLEEVLFVGGGGFSGPKNFLELYPDLQIDVVEIDPDVIQVAKEFFFVEDDPRLNIFNMDARLFLSQTDKKYDAIILDAFSGYSVPYHLLTVEYFELLSDRLDNNGLIVFNFIGTLEGTESLLFESTYKTLSQVFPEVHVFPANSKNTDYRQNITFLVLTENADILETLESGNCSVYPMDCQDLSENYFETTVSDDAIIISDQLSPVDIISKPDQKTDFYEEYRINEVGNELQNTYSIIGLVFLTCFWGYDLRRIWKTAENNS